MFVVWRSEPVKGRSGCAFLAGGGQGGVVPSWRSGLRCEHGGDGRVARTPLLMRAARVDGKPRQELVERLPTIRSCCVADHFNATAWWRHFDDLAASWRARGVAAGMLESFLRDEDAIRAKLREVVPIPSAAGRREFDEHHLRHEREDAERRVLEHQRAERARVRREDEDREAGRIRAEMAREVAAEAERNRVTADDFRALGLHPHASHLEAWEAWRALCKRLSDPWPGAAHSPDARRYHEVQEAWARIEVAEKRRRADLLIPRKPSGPAPA